MKKCACWDRSDLVHRLLAAGCPLEIQGDALDSAHSAGSGLLIEQVSGLTESLVFDLDDGGAAYILSVIITNHLPRPVRIQDIHLEPPWPTPHFRWLEDPPPGAPQRNLYCFPGLAPEFDRDVVINGCRGRRIKARLQPGRCIEGLLLGMGPEPIPDRYEHGCFVDMKLSVFVQAETCFSSTVSMWVKRMKKSVKLDQRPLQGRARRKLIVHDAEGADSIVGASAHAEG